MAEKEYIPIDVMLAQIAAIPKVQQAIIHAHLTEKLKLDPEVDRAVTRSRAVWLYDELE